MHPPLRLETIFIFHISYCCISSLERECCQWRSSSPFQKKADGWHSKVPFHHLPLWAASLQQWIIHFAPVILIPKHSVHQIRSLALHKHGDSDSSWTHSRFIDWRTTTASVWLRTYRIDPEETRRSSSYGIQRSDVNSHSIFFKSRQSESIPPMRSDIDPRYARTVKTPRERL